MPRSSGRIALLLATSAMTAFLSHAALAQQAETEEEELQQQGGALLLDQVTIYGDRQGSEVLDLPGNISVIGGDRIEAQGVSDMQELTRYLPGISVQRQTSQADPFSTFGGFTIRGVGGNRVQMLVDGSRMAERIVDGTRDYLDFNFTRQVDVVRGPASVLWGADALGGVVAVETLDPEDVLEGRDRGGSVKAAHDTFNKGTNVALTFGQRLSPDMTMLVGLSRETASEPELSNARADGGLYAFTPENNALGLVGCPRDLAAGATPCNRFNPMDIDSTRLLAKLVWEPSDIHRLEFSADLLRRDTFVAYNHGLGVVRNTSTLVPTGEILHGHDRDLALERQRYAVEHTWTPGLPLVESVKTTLAFTPHSYDRTGLRRSTSAGGERINTRDSLYYSEEFLELDVQATSRFTTGRAEHELTWGFDGDLTDTDYRRVDVTTNLTTGVVTETRAGGFNFANASTRRADIYVQDRITFADGALELTPGLRLATYKIDPRADADYQTVPGLEPVTREDEKLLASLGALYRFNDTYSVWGHYGQGFKMPTAQQLYTSVPSASGNFNQIPAPDLLPEEVESVEIGLRGEYGRGFFAVNAFHADYTNFINSFVFVPGQAPGTTDITYENLQRVKIWGLEASGAWEINDRLTATFSAAWQKGKQRGTPASAETPHNVAPLVGTLGLAWDIPEYDLTLEAVGIFAKGVEDTQSPTAFKPAGYGVLDLYASWRVTDTAALNLGMKNVFDRRYFTADAASYGMTPSPLGVALSNPLEMQVAPGRVFTASLDVKF